MTRRMNVYRMNLMLLLAVWMVSCGLGSPAAVSETSPSDGPEKTACPNGIEVKVPVQLATKPALTDETVVAQVGDRQVLGGQLRQRWLARMQPDYHEDLLEIKPVDPNEVVLELVGEIILAQEGRAQGLLDSDKILKVQVAKKRRQLLVAAAFRKYVAPHVKVNDEEIKKAMAEDKKLDQARARQKLMRSKSQSAFAAYIEELKGKQKLQLQRQNFAQTAAIHKRLLERPKEARKQSWILNKQIREELTPAEKGMVLASFTGGQFTVEDLFLALGDMAPPGRPRNLSTPAGVEQFLNRSYRYHLVSAVAVAEGLDKLPEVADEIRSYEDNLLRNKVEKNIGDAVPHASEAEIEAYYQRFKDKFQRTDVLKAHVIWCRNKAAAQGVVEKLKQGKDPNQVRTELGSDPKPDKPIQLYANTEGPFWPEIWAANTHDVVGPLLGFYYDQTQRQQTLQWRAVKIVTKKVGASKPLDENGLSNLKWRIKAERNKAAVAKKVRQCLPRYDHKLFPQYFDYFDPRRVP